MDTSTLIAIFGAVAAAGSFLAASFTYVATDRQRKINQNLQTIKFLEYDAQLFQKIYDCKLKISQCEKISEYQIWSQKLEATYFEMYNFYENLCYSYRTGTIDRSYFEEMYRDVIVELVENGEYLNKLNTTYVEISKVYNKFKK